MFGEIIICQFPFTSGAPGKIRPALVLFDLGQDAVICRITSQTKSGLLDVEIKDWSAVRLLSASTARLDRLITIEKSIIKQHIGHLSQRDEHAVSQAWNQHMRL
jgi:mRNA-degrading endonuclease toxin of MazEF toxin-antitoxin module